MGSLGTAEVKEMLVTLGMCKRKMPGVVRAATRAARLFGRAEDGTLVIFALMLFVLMTMMGGLAIDLMKYEQTRTTLQNTLDRSTLAAASLTQKLDPKSVVNDYVAKAGMSEFLTGVEIVEGLNFRQVIAKATADAEPYFLHMVGIEELNAKGVSGAEQRISNVEIVLVLDVSGSMQGAKLTNLKAAASEFVQTLMANDLDDRFSVAIVPYNAQVNLGATLRSKYNATFVHGVTNIDCLEVPSGAYSTIGMSRTLAMPMSAFADPISNTTRNTTYVAATSTHGSTGATMIANEAFCRNTVANIVRLPSNNVTVLRAQINALVADGNTSIMLGMKWATALIEPGARGMFNELITQGAIPAKYSGRPFDWSDQEAMKVIVLMTDGEHVAHPLTNDPYKTGTAPIWRSTGDGNYSILHTTRPAPNQHWVPHLGTWQATAWNSGSGVVQQTWQSVWSAQRQTWVAWQLYARALGTTDATRNTSYTNTMNLFRSNNASAGTMNAQLQQSCTLAKTNGVIVYGIAFEAPTNGAAQISACASSSSHYFNATGLQITTAFRAIASNISQLRLTQ